MAFSGFHHHKVEPRGRVSIPAEFRRVLADAKVTEIVLVPQLRDDTCHMFFTERGRAAYADSFDQMELDADQQRAIDEILYGEARILPIDDLGRIVIPEDCRGAIGVGSECVFVGGRGYFEMYSPEGYEAQKAARRAKAREAIGQNRMRGGVPV